MIWIILYIAVAALVTFALCVAAFKITNWDAEYDFPWPFVCGALWPIAAPFAAAYIAARWYSEGGE